MVFDLGIRHNPSLNDCVLWSAIGSRRIRCQHSRSFECHVRSYNVSERGRGSGCDPSRPHQARLRARLMTIKQPSSNRDFALYLRLFRWARPYWTHLIGLFLLGLLATPLALLVPLPLKIALDSGLGSKPLPHLIRSFLPAGFSLSPSSALLFAVGLLIAVTIL